MENRREFFETGVHGCLSTLTLAATAATVVTTATASAAAPEEAAAKADAQRFLLVGLCGSENPTRANFPFVWAAALKEAGHEVRIELAGDGTVMMRTVVGNNVTAVGWPPFREALARVVDHKIPIYI